MGRLSLFVSKNKYGSYYAIVSLPVIKHWVCFTKQKNSPFRRHLHKKSNFWRKGWDGRYPPVCKLKLAGDIRTALGSNPLFSLQKTKNLPFWQVSFLAEGVGFEPTVPVTRHNCFRDSPVQPLLHPSVSYTINYCCYLCKYANILIVANPEIFTCISMHP